MSPRPRELVPRVGKRARRVLGGIAVLVDGDVVLRVVRPSGRVGRLSCRKLVLGVLPVSEYMDSWDGLVYAL